MNDQANVLRGLMEQRAHATASASSTAAPGARTIAVTSGKGGVGKSHIALNLAVGLAQLDAAVCLLDANMGLGNIDLLCGMNGYWNLSHVLTGARRLEDIILQGPGGIDVIPGASGLHDSCASPKGFEADVLERLVEREMGYDFVVLDTGTGIHHNVRSFLNAADLILTITTPEPTSIADAYATIKMLSADGHSAIEVLINQVQSVQESELVFERIRRTALTFLRTQITSAGAIPFDPCVARAVVERRPFLVTHPACPAAIAVTRLAHRMRSSVTQRTPELAYFRRLQQTMHRTA